MVFCLYFLNTSQPFFGLVAQRPVLPVGESALRDETK